MNEMTTPEPARDDRCPGITYTDMLNVDTRRPRDFLFAESTQELGDAPLDPARYTSEAFAQAERDRLWPAREEDLPEPGDNVVYDINERS